MYTILLPKINYCFGVSPSDCVYENVCVLKCNYNGTQFVENYIK